MPREGGDPRMADAGARRLSPDTSLAGPCADKAGFERERLRWSLGGAGGSCAVGRSSSASPDLQEGFSDELKAARRRVAILEEANRAIQESIDRVTRLSRFSEGLDRSVSIGDVTDLLFEEIRGILPSEVMLLAVVDAEGREFRPIRSAPPDLSALVGQELEAQVASGMFGWAIGLRRPTMVSATHLGKNLILVPLATARRTVGMLMVGTPLAADAVEQQHLTLAAVVTRQAAECVDNLWLTEDIHRQHEARRSAAEAAVARRVADLGLLVETAASLSAAREQGTALRFLAESSRQHLGAHTVAILLQEPDGRLTPAYVAGPAGHHPGGAECDSAHPCPLAWVARERKPLVISQVPADPRARDCTLLRQTGALSVLGVPLVARDRVIGVLSAMTEEPREFAHEEVALLTGLAAQGAGAIENARLFADLQGRMEQHQRAMGRLVQSAHLASVGLLAGGVAHDINNPLCIISNHLQLLRLRGAKLQPEVAESLGPMEVSVERIASSIAALLEYARVRPGEKHPSDLNDGIRRILLLLRHHPLCGRLDVVTDLDADLPLVDLDNGAWEQVMLELVTNAHEAMTDGGRVSVSTRRLPRGRGCEDASEEGTSGGAAGSALSEDDGTAESAWVEVVVEDEGPGFPPEESSRIFDPFFTTKTAKRGMGIGLKICRDIVMEHGGRLHVESGRERGARVVVEMPGSGKAPDGRSSEGEAGWPWGSSSVASA